MRDNHITCVTTIMPKTTSKMSTAKKTMKDPELLDMFNQMCGIGDPDPAIAVPKYDELIEKAKKITNMFRAFALSPFAGVFRKDYATSFDEILTYCEEASAILEEHTLRETDNGLASGDKLNELNKDRNLMAQYIASINSKYDLKELAEVYPSLKECRPVQEIIMITKNLKNVLVMEQERTKSKHHNLENRDALSMSFITHCEGDSLTLFGFSGLDFKQISYDEQTLTSKLQDYMLYFLHILYKQGLEIVRLITSPDIDVDKFSQVLVDNIGEVKKHIPRCDKAFDKIAKSVDLLKGNFDDYYKDFVISQNPSVIIENFVGDVAKNSKADAQTAAQFRKIVQFYKQKMKSQAINDPNVKKIFNMVGSNLDVLDEEVRSGNADSPETPQAPPRDMSDPNVRKEVERSFLPDQSLPKSRGKGGRSAKK